MHDYYLGIDSSKGYADFVILNAQKQCVVKNFQLDDTFQGHRHLYAQLLKFAQAHPKAMLYAAVESTGGYENNWYHSLLQFQATLALKTARLNPFGVNHNSKSDLKRNTTDKISAQNVAEYLIAHREKASYQPHDRFASLRKQWRFIQMLSKHHSQLLNQLESLLYSANPELLAYCKHGVCAWILKLLIRYPTAAHLAKARVKSVARIPYITAVRAQVLVGNAKKTVASITDTVTGELIVETVRQIMHLKKIISAQSEKLQKQCLVPEVDLLKTFKGINDYSAIGLMLQIQTVHRFASVKKLASFLGLHPVFKISGDGVGAFRMSKKGRKEAREVLYMVALTAIRRNPYIRSIYLQHTERGMKKKAAIGLCMHKILRIIYGMLKHNQAFDPQIDQKNRERAINNSPKAWNDKSRRYQDYDPKAPISRRQNKKRMERKALSHSGHATKRGINAPVPQLK